VKRAWILAALVAAPISVPASADSVALTVQTGQWYQVFANDIERVIGRSVRVDAASVAPGGLGRQFRQAEVLLRTERGLPRGTRIYAQRSVDCRAGRQVTYRWSAVGPTSETLTGQTYTSPQISKIYWDSPDGKVLRFVCTGILPR
jgi:hypothetical protein